MTDDIKKLLKLKYGNNVEISSPICGTCKQVYIVNDGLQKFAILVDKQTAITHQYRFLRSNYFQKFLFDNGLNVPNVEEIFVVDKRIAARHTFIDGTRVERLDEKSAYEIGKTVAEFHLINSSKFKPRYPTKYKIFALLDKIKNALRLYKECLFHPEFCRLPRGICHYDLNLKNFFWLDDKLFMIDFDRYRYWAFAHELWRFMKGRQLSNVVLQGYQSVRKLEECEKKYLRTKNPDLKL